MSDHKVFSKGDVLFKEGDRIQSLVVIQSGKVSLYWQKDGKRLECQQVAGPTILGEGALLGANQFPFWAFAVTEVKVVYLPLDALKNQMEQLPQSFKLILKTALERYRNILSEVKNYKLEKLETVFPEDKVPKVFGSLYYIGSIRGEKTSSPRGEAIVLRWSFLKSFLQKAFEVNPKWIENAILILKKLGYAEVTFEEKTDEKDNSAPVMDKILIYDWEKLGWFVDYYTAYFFRADRTHLVRYDESAYRIVEVLVHLANQGTMTSKGYVRITFDGFQEELKSKYGIPFSPDQQTRMENKGVFVKRVAEGGWLEFDVREVSHIFFSWQIQRELELLNVNGYVDPEEPKANAPKADGGQVCPSCHGAIEKQHKFCPHCGFKLASAA